MIAEGITKENRPEAIEPWDKVWGVGVSGLDENISPFPRINKMLDKTKNATSMVDTQRAEILTEAYEKYKADPQLIKVAKAFRDIISNVKINIEEDELIVGEIAAPAWHAPLYPDFSIRWLRTEIDDKSVPDFADRANDAYVVTEEVRDTVRKLYPKWDGVSNEDLIRAALDPEDAKGSSLCGNGMYANDLYSYNGIGHISVDYYKLLAVGYGGLKKEVEAKLAAIEEGADPQNIKKRIFWKAQLISLEGQ